MRGMAGEREGGKGEGGGGRGEMGEVGGERGEVGGERWEGRGGRGEAPVQAVIQWGRVLSLPPSVLQSILAQLQGGEVG